MGSNLLIDVNDSLQSWLNNPTINVAAIFPENFRCIISGPSQCGKTFLLKNLNLDFVDFDKLYIIGTTGNQYKDLEYKDIKFIKDIKELPQPDKLPEHLKKLMILTMLTPVSKLLKNTSVEVDIIIVI